MVSINEELLLLSEEYYQRFGENIPMRMIPQSISCNDLCERIRVCLEEGSTDSLEILFKDVSEDVLV